MANKKAPSRKEGAGLFLIKNFDHPVRGEIKNIQITEEDKDGFARVIYTICNYSDGGEIVIDSEAILGYGDYVFPEAA